MDLSLRENFQGHALSPSEGFLAIYQLQGEPERWWAMNEPADQTASWAQFLVLFKKKYIPQSILHAKLTKFQQLKQRGYMTVTAYEAEFTNLAEYAPCKQSRSYKPRCFRC